MDIECLEEFTHHTVFVVSHLKKVLGSMENGGKIEATRPSGSKRGYPKGTQVRFGSTLGI